MVIADLAAGSPGELALLAPDREPLSYRGLAALVDRTRISLQQLGFAPHHCIAAALPNGPELAASFLSISAAAGFAPLNPSYSATEFRFYLEDLQAAALLTIPGYCPAAEQAARSLEIPLLSLTPDTAAPAGTFQISGGKLKSSGKLEPEREFALMLHSSGTTARPKLVGLTHHNLRASAQAIASTLRLGPQDRGLNIMPLFHIHGLVGSLLSSLTAGASVYCPPGFSALSFAGWMADANATWYTAVPTMHQLLLTRADAIRKQAQSGFRFIRSSSAHLHTRVWREMEAKFDCPVLNTYGMTEAAHQVASNPLPPGERKYGSTGPGAGPEIAILNEASEPQPPGTPGEVAIRGRNVIASYLVPAEANQTAFTNGWFRTGDEGVMDPQGYLTLTGRLKELINSGGEKISPAEVDAAFMQHPAVTQAVTFGVKCDTRGERVYTAVVLGAAATESDLKTFARERLAAFKAPSKILIVLDIPKGPTGKLQRTGMARSLGLE